MKLWCVDKFIRKYDGIWGALITYAFQIIQNQLIKCKFSENSQPELMEETEPLRLKILFYLISAGEDRQ